jgi:hypothetical protein
MNFKTHAPARREGTTLQPNIHTLSRNIPQNKLKLSTLSGVTAQGYDQITTFFLLRFTANATIQCTGEK